MMEYTVLAILWIIWCSIHSAMISLTVTGYLKARVKYYRFYRMFFNLVAVVTITPLIIYTQSLKGDVLFRWEGYLLAVRFFLIAVSIFFFISGALKYDILQFIGIRQIISKESFSTLSENGEIITSGILGITRHPWYLGSIIFVWIYYEDMYVSTLIISAILTVYLPMGTFLEERKLIIEFGDNYRDYRGRVSMLFPFKWILSKIRTVH